jgi:RNA polymerase sigma-70 factor (ECF subfamily)
VDYQTIPANDLALLCFDKGNEFAWREFIRRFQPLIAKVVMRIGRQWGESSPQVIDELVQETYLKLYSDRARFVEKFAATHEDAVFGYIKVFTANLVHDYFKALRSKKRGGAAKIETLESPEAERQLTPAVTSSYEAERQIMFREIDTCLRKLGAGAMGGRDRRIFWLYYRVGLSATAIATLPNIGLTTKGVESTLLRLTRYVREQLVERRIKTAPESPEGIRPAESL